MKTALLPNPENAPSNIIYLTRELLQDYGDNKETTARIQPRSTRSTGLNIRQFLQDPSRSQVDMRGFLTDTSEILARHFGNGPAFGRVNRCLSGLSETILFVLPDVCSPEGPSESDASASTHRPMKISKSRARMEELFALKRQELPPENFISEFMLEFQRRNYSSAAPPRPSASKRKNSKRS